MIPGSWFNSTDGLWHWRTRGGHLAACKKVDVEQKVREFLPADVDQQKVCLTCQLAFDRALEHAIPRIDAFIQSYRWSQIQMRSRRARLPE